MKIEAVTVSINYTDYLRQCLPNRHLLDRWVIVTHRNDRKTIDLCQREGLEYILSDRIYEDGAPFAKGKAINEGLAKLNRDQWLLVLDSDILLPGDFREVLLNNVSDNDHLYWSRRYKKNGKEIVSKWNLTCLGFFQLWHSLTLCHYPENSNSARNDDVIMRKNFGDLLYELPLNCMDVSELQGHFHLGRKRHELLLNRAHLWPIYRVLRSFVRKLKA